MGMLPFAHLMPTLLTDHIDRNEPYLMLKGTTVLFHSIDMELEDDKDARTHPNMYIMKRLPKTVYVQKPNVTWTIGTCTIPGLYPIKCKKALWYLDAHHKPPKLAIDRYQFPLSPVVCLTVHATQGMDKDPLMLDVNTRDESSKQTCYVGMSRAKHKKGINLLRPFPLETFQGDPPLVPSILLKKLRGEKVQWGNVRVHVEAETARQRTKTTRNHEHQIFSCAVCANKTGPNIV